MVESQFHLRNNERVLNLVSDMLDLFPESEVTGYSLIMMARIYEQNDRVIDAAEIYRTVRKSFPYFGVQSKAKLALERLRM